MKKKTKKNNSGAEREYDFDAGNRRPKCPPMKPSAMTFQDPLEFEDPVGVANRLAHGPHRQVANRMSLSNSSSFCWGVSTSFFFLPSEESALNWTQRARHRLIGRGRANQKSMAQGNETRPLFFGCFFSLSLFSAASETGGIIANKSILRESRCCGANPFKGTG